MWKQFVLVLALGFGLTACSGSSDTDGGISGLEVPQNLKPLSKSEEDQYVALVSDWNQLMNILGDSVANQISGEVPASLSVANLQDIRSKCLIEVKTDNSGKARNRTDRRRFSMNAQNLPLGEVCPVEFNSVESLGRDANPVDGSWSEASTNTSFRFRDGSVPEGFGVTSYSYSSKTYQLSKQAHSIRDTSRQIYQNRISGSLTRSSELGGGTVSFDVYRNKDVSESTISDRIKLPQGFENISVRYVFPKNADGNEVVVFLERKMTYDSQGKPIWSEYRNNEKIR